jgi:hypothetical protein
MGTLCGLTGEHPSLSPAWQVHDDAIVNRYHMRVAVATVCAALALAGCSGSHPSAIHVVRATTPRLLGIYALGIQASVPATLEGYGSGTAYGFYPNISTDRPNVDIPPSGDTYAAIDASECVDYPYWSSPEADATDFRIRLSNGFTVKPVTFVGTPTVPALSAESALASYTSGFTSGCDRGWIVFDIPDSVTPTFVQWSGITNSKQGDSDFVVKWAIPAG